MKDLLGGITIGKIFDFKYVHTCYPYLDFFALGQDELKICEINEEINYLRYGGPFWGGMSLVNAQNLFDDIAEKFKEKDCLVTFENALRIHPCQTIKWFNEGLIEKNIFKKILEETTRKFETKHYGRKTYFEPGCIHIAIHINRGADYDSVKYPEHFANHENVRYMFPLAYYKRIVDQISEKLGDKKHIFHIYTEKLNSEEIVKEFVGRENTILHIGENRGEGNNQLAHEIFYHFVKSDVLVTSNSSFSVMASYFRDKKITIYHPHAHLFGLPEDRFLATDPEGSFNSQVLTNLFQEQED